MFLSKRSNGIWYIFYTQDNGKRTCVSTKMRYKQEALKFLSDFSNNLKIERDKEFISLSLKEFTFEYLKYSESYHTWKTTSTYKTTFNSLLDYFGNIPLIELTKKKIDDYIQSKIRNVSIYSARKDLINIKASLNWAVNNNYLIENPSENIKRIKTPERLPLYFSKSDFEKLVKSIDNQDIIDLITFAVNTGLRQGELINLRFNQFDFKNRLLILDNRTHLTKSKKVRKIPLNNVALNIIENRVNHNLNDVIFSINGNEIKQDYIVHKFKDYVIKAKVNPKLHFHSLRHTFASWLIHSGASIYHVSRLLGHADIKTTEIYSHLRNDDLQNTIDLLN